MMDDFLALLVRKSRNSDRGRLLSVWLGMVPYDEAWRLQQRLAAARAGGQLPRDVLLLLEHPHTYTMGRRTPAHHIRWTGAELAARGISVYTVDRGGLATYHGPGQLVGYPIVHLKERGLKVTQYVTRLEQALVNLLAAMGIPGHREPEHRGVWTTGGKIAAIGIRCSRWVTSHGFALNVNTDLSYFQGLIPCGSAHQPVTSVVRQGAGGVTAASLQGAAARHVAASLDYAGIDEVQVLFTASAAGLPGRASLR